MRARGLTLSLCRRALAVIFIFCASTRVDAAQITLAWDPPSDPSVVGYIIEYGTADAPFSTQVNVGGATTWTFTSAAAGATYTFHVRAFNSDGIESDPSNEVSATIPSDSSSTSTTTSTSSCTTPDPFAAMGGGTCYNGGWLPPGMAVPTAESTYTAPTYTPPPTYVAPTSTAGCTTPDPFASMGGGTCYNGGWLPPGMAVPTAAATYTAPTPTYAAPTYTPPPTYIAPTSTVGCSTPDPFAAMGGGTCYNGGWLPPGMAAPGGGTTQPLQPASTPVPVTTTIGGCSGTDPFASISGLIGVCENGGWAPFTALLGTVTQIGGTWDIVGDNGITYAPVATLDPTLQQDGLRVVFAGTLQGLVDNAMVVTILRITTF